MLVTTWMAESGMKMVRHSPYSPDAAPCNYFLFPRMKDPPQRNQISVNRGDEKGIGKFLKGQLGKDFEEVFQEWEQCMKKCVKVDGNYFEGVKVL